MLAGCRFLVCLLLEALQGVHKDELAGAAWNRYTQHPTSTKIDALAAIGAGSFRDKMPPQIIGGGTLYNALEAALWALYRADDFHSGAL